MPFELGMIEPIFGSVVHEAEALRTPNAVEVVVRTGGCEEGIIRYI